MKTTRTPPALYYLERLIEALIACALVCFLLIGPLFVLAHILVMFGFDIP